MVDAVGTTVYTFTSGGLLWTENGPFASDTVTNTYWNRMRVKMDLQQPTGLWTNAFGYDPARRLWDVTSPAGEFDYQYQDSSPSTLVQKLLLPNTSYITNIYDGNARLLGTWLKNSGNTMLDQQGYTYNAGNQRVTWTNYSTVFALYAYDKIGQLTIASNNNAANSRGYRYDAAWNLNYRTNNTTSQTFTVDGLNELTNAPDGSCTYDGNGNLVSAGGGTWGYTYDDENRLLTVTSNNVATGYTATETLFYYDGQGRLRRRLELHNIVADGGSFTNIETDAVGFVGGDVDSVGGGGGITWMTNSETLYIYDGKRVIQERNGSNTPLVSYTRGSDLSGSLEGAGGIGGLLARTDNTMLPSTNAHAFYHADGNGNITYLVNNSQSYAAIYQYDPFGNMVYSFGALADANTYRFSSKEYIASVGLYYYLYRFYSPNSQRWVNRDPLGDEASGVVVAPETKPIRITVEDVFNALNSEPFEMRSGANINELAFNNPLNLIDTWGLDCWDDFEKCMNPKDICMAALGGPASLIGTALGGAVAGPHTGPKGYPRPIVRAGKLTKYGKGLTKGIGGGFGLGVLAGVLGKETECYAALAGCLSADSGRSLTPLPPPYVPPYSGGPVNAPVVIQ